MPVLAARFRAYLLIIGLIAPLSMSAAVSAQAEDARQPDIIAVIDAQLQAFAAGDRTAAFSHAAPNIQSRFGSPDTFMRMVEGGYSILISPASVDYLSLEDTAEGIIQPVRVIGRDGTARIALYQMEAQPDGSWKISGCYLTEDPARSV